MPGTPIPSDVQVSYRQQYRRCGKPTCARCGAGGPGHGPYWYAFWWQEGRTCSRYVGKKAPLGGATATTAPAHAAPGLARMPLRVQTLGRFAVWRGDEPIPPNAWGNRRAASLFKLLLAAPSQRLPRERAGEVLWPEGEPAASAANLRATLHRLRRVLDVPSTTAVASHVRLEGDMLVLEPYGVGGHPLDVEWLDAAAFAHAARAALSGQATEACRQALARYSGDYLSDDPYADWAAPTRAALRQQFVAVLLHLAALCGARGEVEEAEDCLRQALAMEPGHEEAATTLMSLLAAAGRRGAALRVYQALATALEEEFDVTPSAEIMALRARLVAQEKVIGPALPPPAAHLLARTNLPTPASSFVGRAWEVRDLANLMARHRLVTLTGPGGCGKTRLALEVATARVAAHPDGVWLAELAALANPALVPRAIGAALGIGEQPGRPLLVTLGQFLQSRDLLLVLDNCEHLLAACAALIADLLAACPHLRVLATSRQVLAVAGEHTYLVPSLTTPDPADPAALERLDTYEAVQLFLERASTRRPDLMLTATTARAMAQICARLDGLPLAIELAAARVGVLAVEGIAERLDDRFRLLTGGARTALPRQQTLRATIDWSYALLDPTEQTLFARLAVFAGGWTLEAAEEVCAADSGAGRQMLDLLSALVDRSLVVVHAAESDVRYGYLETVRAFARERLEASGEDSQAGRRHLAYYLTLAGRAETALWGPDQVAWFRRLAAEQDNLRAALAEALAHDEVTLALRLAGTLWRFWIYHGDYEGWRRLIEAALARAEEAAAPPLVRARALHAAGWLAFHQWDYVVTAALGAESLRCARASGDALAVRHALVILGKAAYGQGQQAEAIPLFAEAIAMSRALGVGATHFLAPTLASLGMALAKAGEAQQAEERITEALVLLREQGETYIAAQCARSLAHLILARGEEDRAAALFGESLQLSAQTGHKLGLAETLEGVAAVCAARGQAEQAGHLFGAAGALREAADQPQHPDERMTLAPYLTAARAQLGAAAWASAFAEGHALPLPSAVNAATEASRPGSAAQGI